MASKRPSSLDYGAHLHELALGNWRRAILDRDTARAETNARALTASHDKFWRWLGGLHLGLARLCGGRAAAALEAFTEAAGAYPDAHELATLPRALSAHTHLELGSPERALAVLENAALTPETKYWRALSLARLSENGEARKVAATIDEPVLAEHVMSVLTGDLDLLRKAANHAAGKGLSSPRPWVPIRYALGVALMEGSEPAEAARIFTEIRAVTNAVLHWPIPCIRSLQHVGDLSVKSNDLALAHEAYSELLHFWSDGDIDRTALTQAAQFVKS